jgi:ribonuclease P protein component
MRGIRCLERTNLRKFIGRGNMVLEKECQRVPAEQCLPGEEIKEEKNFQDKKFKLLSLKMRRDFRRVYVKGQKKYTADLIIYTLLNYSKQTRVGISVSKKVGCAVKRNRARRIIKEAFRILKLNISRDIVVVAKPSILGKKMQNIYDELQIFFKNKNNYLGKHAG